MSAADRFDVAVLGGGFAGLATAARLAGRGLSVVVLERHGQVGGCAGFFTRRGFSFDVGATTLVDFEPGGVGGELLRDVGLELPLEVLPGYRAWLPDREVDLHRDPAAWRRERAAKLGDSPAHRRLYALLDRLADVFWRASRDGLTLPLTTPAELWSAVRLLRLSELGLARHLGRTLGEAIREAGLAHERPLRALYAMLVEDTVHATLEDAPLINAALGITIRGAGLSRCLGGMRTAVTGLAARIEALGGRVRTATSVTRFSGRPGDFWVETRRGIVRARHVVSALPLEIATEIGPPALSEALRPYRARNRGHAGGALVLFLAVPEEEVAGSAWTHHQLLGSYDRPLGDGNNMFVSVSSAGDRRSAPAGHRAVMISTHCELAPWQGLDEAAYEAAKAEAKARLLAEARRAYPGLGERASFAALGTPRTYARYTGRPLGAVGGFRQWLGNTNQNAVPHDVGLPGIHLVGDGTWPGLGTVAACLASRDVANRVSRALGPTAETGRARTERRIEHGLQ